jgi:hypothetical protein
MPTRWHAKADPASQVLGPGAPVHPGRGAAGRDRGGAEEEKEEEEEEEEQQQQQQDSSHTSDTFLEVSEVRADRSLRAAAQLDLARPRAARRELPGTQPARQSVAEGERLLPALRVEVGAAEGAARRIRGDAFAALRAVPRMHGNRMAPADVRTLNAISAVAKKHPPSAVLNLTYPSR